MSRTLARSNGTVLLDKLRKSILSNGLMGSSILVAFSGGPDSTTLLHALCALKDDLGLELQAAHLDHGLRPDSSKADAEFARKFAASLGVPLTIEKADTHAFLARHGLSVEDAARRLRYEFLSRTAADAGAGCVAVGHTLDDQAETVLLHILRGAGVDGLGAMKELSSRDVGGRRLTLFRPMLSISRSEVLDYCAENDLTPQLDESNLSTRFTRNRIRLDLIPRLADYNPSIQSALARLAHSASLDSDFILAEVERVAEDLVSTDSRGVSIGREGFTQLHPALGHRLLRHAVRMAKGDLDDLEYDHVSQMFDMMSGSTGKGMALPGGLCFDVDYGFAHIRRAEISDSPLAEMGSGQFTLKVPGTTVEGGWSITALLRQDRRGFRQAKDGELSFMECFDADALGRSPIVRTRRVGDTFQPLGMAGAKKLKDFMIDAHIPRRWRDSVPLVESGGRIAWVVGWRIAEWAKVTADTRMVLEIRFEKTSES